MPFIIIEGKKMQIKILCVGKLKEKYWQDAVAEYKKRLTPYAKLEIQEIKESRSDDICEEGENILDKLSPEDYVIALAIKGKKFASEEFSAQIEKIMADGSKKATVFIIGGSQGLADEVLKRANLEISFSAMTFPHQMMRVILLEQVYRAFKIMKNEPYHK